MKIELEDFYNDGFGWICKHCERELIEEQQQQQQQQRKKISDATTTATETRSRLLREGEAESKNPRLSNPAPARWADQAQRTLICPRCGITELADKF